MGTLPSAWMISWAVTDAGALFHRSNAAFWIVVNKGVPERQEMSKSSATAPTFL